MARKGIWKFSLEDKDYILELDFSRTEMKWEIIVNGETIHSWYRLDLPKDRTRHNFEFEGKPAYLQLCLFNKWKATSSLMTIYDIGYALPSPLFELSWVFFGFLIKWTWKLYINEKEVR